MKALPPRPRQERHPARSFVGAQGEDLMYLQPSRLEAERRPRHEQAPDARAGAPHFGDSLVPASLEVPDPGAQRESVVLAQILDVAHFEAGLVDHRNNVADLMQLAIGEDVAVDEASPSEGPPLPRGPGDAVVEEAAAGLQQAIELLEVHPELREADVLEHAD